jgi:hypothetical protein
MGPLAKAGNTKGISITVPLTSSLTGLDQSVLLIKSKTVSCHTADSKPVKEEVNGTVILPPLVFPGLTMEPLLLADLEIFFSSDKRSSLFLIATKIILFHFFSGI